MDYLCLAVKKEVARSESGSREQAREFFWEKFGDCVKEELERERKRLEGRIGFYDRREAKHGGEPEVREVCRSRREAARRELDGIDRQLRGGREELRVWYYEGKGDFDVQVSGGEMFLVLWLAGICRVGSGFQVVEERYFCSLWKEDGDKGILEVRNGMPGDVAKNSICLDICRDSGEAVERFQRKIKKMMAEARRNFRGRFVSG